MVNEILTVCPGAPISLTCSYEVFSNVVTRWEVTGPTTCAVLIGHDPPTPGTCGPFTINMVSAMFDTPRSSTAQATATDQLHGVTVMCRDGSRGSDPQVGIVTIRVVGKRN